jgi:hypothetical protein
VTCPNGDVVENEDDCPDVDEDELEMESDEAIEQSAPTFDQGDPGDPGDQGDQGDTEVSNDAGDGEGGDAEGAE